MYSSIPLLLITGYLLYDINGLNEKISAFEEKMKTPLSVSDCFSCGDTSGRKPFDYLEVATLKDMASSYQGIVRRRVRQSSGTTVDDANSIWFSLDALKSFIWEIQKDTCGKSCDGKALQLGVRIYYAKYPQFNLLNTAGGLRYPDIQSVNKDYESMHTVFMIPTYDSAGYQKDFDPRYYDAENKCLPKTIDADTWPVAQRILALTPDNYTAQNHGGLCPPLKNCPGSAFQK